MKKLVLITVLVLAVFTVNAEKNVNVEKISKSETAAENVMTISGLIVDNSTNETLVGAVITVDGEKIYSDLDGNFTLTNMKSGKVKLTVSMISYTDQVIEVDAKADSNLKIKLKHI